ncbi:MAG TPA: hypothetical protein VM841_09130, partial [Actinomycetota bacterium]|nr:hypothetical protein [Actinomycetota bacterium]
MSKVRRRLVFASFAAVLLLAAALPATGRAQAHTVRVIVQASSAEAAADAVRSAGGRVERPLSIVDGVAAVASSAAVEWIRRDPQVRAVTDNGPVRFFQESSKNLSTYKHTFPLSTAASSLWSEG